MNCFSQGNDPWVTYNTTPVNSHQFLRGGGVSNWYFNWIHFPECWFIPVIGTSGPLKRISDHQSQDLSVIIHFLIKIFSISHLPLKVLVPDSIPRGAPSYKRAVEYWSSTLLGDIWFTSRIGFPREIAIKQEGVPWVYCKCFIDWHCEVIILKIWV